MRLNCRKDVNDSYWICNPQRTGGQRCRR